MKESHIQKAIEEYLIYKGALVLRINGGGKKRGMRYIPFYRWWCIGRKSSSEGVSDIFAFLPGKKFIAIETKTKKGKASKAQMEFIEELKDRGFVGGICNSIEEVDELLESG